MRILKLFERFHKEKQRKLNTPDQQQTVATGAHGQSHDAAGSNLIPFRTLIFAWLLFFLVAVAIHYAGLASPMIYDSKAWIADKAHIFASRDPLEVIRITPGRPLLMMSLYVNFLLTGMDPAYFRLANAMCLAATGVALALMIFFVLGTPGSSAKVPAPQRWWISLFAGLLFVVHPLQTFAVLYIWQRGAIMGCFFYFSAVAVYVGARSEKLGPVTPAYILTGVLLFAGLMSKENLGTLPVMLVLAELILFRQSIRNTMRRAIIIAFISCVPALLYSILTSNLHSVAAVHPPGFFVRLRENYADSGLNPLEVGLSECRVLFSYLATIVVPFVHEPQLIRAETISRSLLDPRITLVAFLGTLSLLGIGIGLVRKNPLTSFGILFFIITFSLESLAVAQFLFFGYRALLPMAGVLLIMAQALCTLLYHSRRALPKAYFTPAVGLAALLPVICFAAITCSQSRTWDPSQFWERAFAELPPFSGNVELTPYVTVLMSYGGQLVDSDRDTEAIDILSQAIRIGCGHEQPGAMPGSHPRSRVSGPGPVLDIKAAPCPEMKSGFEPAYYNLGIIALRLGDFAESATMFRAALALRPDFAAAINGLGESLLRSGDAPEAARLFRKAIDMEPSCTAAINNLGNVLLGTGKASDAIDLYRKGIALTAGSPQLHNNLGAALLGQGRVPQARDEFRRAVTLKPRFAKAWGNLGLASLRMGDIPAAMENLNAALAIDPGLSLAYVYRGQACELSGHVNQAAQDYAKAVEISPTLVQGQYNLARIMVKTNHTSAAIAHYEKVLQLDPQHYMAHYELGSLLVKTSQCDKGAQHLRKALEIRPDWIEARTRLEEAEKREAHKAVGQ
jgi:protein O-mannosyl-transferase